MRHLHPDLVMASGVQVNAQQPFGLSADLILCFVQHFVRKSGLFGTGSTRGNYGGGVGFSIFFQIVFQNLWFMLFS